MGFASFLGRVLFASLFILSAWQMFNEFGDDGGPAAKELVGKLAVLKKHVSSHLGVEIPDIDVRHLVASIIVQKGLGGLLFIFGNLLGAYLLVFYLIVGSPILYDFYNYGQDEPEYHSLLNEFLLG
uniref:Uncharacterized protein n=1 Tax=Rhizophora mucronata TaxID=61149 RepID=A0A2P2JFD0_RHIMU